MRRIILSLSIGVLVGVAAYAAGGRRAPGSGP